jgi:transcriptional regulator with XRE-family HTH domain
VTITTTATQPHERMSRARLFAGLDQSQMATMLGKSRNTVSAWERGVNEPSVTDVARWALITGQTIEWIVWGDVRPKGLEPLTFWSVVTGEDDAFWTANRASAFDSIVCQFFLDAESRNVADVS